jgi:site-specific DNA recombinase
MTTTIHKKRALAYLRISNARQINGESSETQRTTIQKYADANDIEVVEWFYDEAKSGKNADRAELVNLLNVATKMRNKIDHVIVYKMNRASRDVDSYITAVRVKLQSIGITVRSATEQFDDSPMGHFMEIFHVLVGQMDNENKRDFTVDNMSSLAMQGYWQNQEPLGYDRFKLLNDLGKFRPSLKPNNKAPLVKQVLERFSEADITKAELTRYAKDIGLRSRNSKILSEDSVHRLLKAPVYAGYVQNNLTKQEMVDGKHAAIISKETFELNQSILYGPRTKKGEPRSKANADYPLKGLVKCPNCRQPLYASAPKTGGGGKSPRYHCSRKSCKGLVKSVSTAVMHDAFYSLLATIKPTEGILKLYKEVLISEASQYLGKTNKKITRLHTELEQISSSRLMVIKNYSDDKLTLDEKNELVDSYDSRKFQINSELDDLKSIQTVQEADIDHALNIMLNIDRQWNDSNLDNRQRFQTILFPKGLIYDYKVGGFGTSEISALYRYVPTKKGSEEPSKPFLVAGVGFEPTTLWL